MAERQGVMIYNEVFDAVRSLPLEDVGQLFLAIGDYSHYGILPEFDGALNMAWKFIQPKVDRDREKYEEKVLRNTYSAYCGKQKKAARTPLDFEDWLSERQRSAANAGERRPTTTKQKQYLNTAVAGTATEAGTGAGAVAGTGASSVGGDDFEAMRRSRMALLEGYDG